MFSKKNKKAKPKLVAVFDVGSGSVGGSLVSIARGSLPEILFSTRENLVFQDELDFERFIKSMQSTLSSVCEVIAHEGVRALDIRERDIREVHCVFSSPWYVAQTKIISIKNEKPIVVNKKFVQGLLEKERSVFKNSSGVSSSEKAEGGIDMIEGEILDIKLNGYKVPDPVGKKVRDIDIAMYMSVASRKTLSHALNVFEKFFHTEDIYFNTSANAYYKVLEGIVPSPDFLIVDMSSEVTDIFLVENGRLLSNSSFPFGINYVIRELAKKTGQDAPHITSSLKMYEDKHSDKDLEEVISGSLADASTEWTKLAEETISKMGHSIPMNIYTFSYSPFGIILNKFVEDYLQKAYPVQYPHIKLAKVNPAFLKDQAKVQKGLSLDTFLMINSIFVSKENQWK